MHLWALPLDYFWQTYDLDGDTSQTQIFYAPLSADGNIEDITLSAVAVASSGELLAVGSSAGTVTQFSSGRGGIFILVNNFLY